MPRSTPLLLSSFLAVTFIAQLSFAQEPVPAEPPAVQEIKVDFVSLNRAATAAPNNERILGEDWVCVSVKFSTTAPFTDDLTIKVYIDGLEDNKEKQGFTVLSSQLTFVNLTPSREHYARFYIAPTAALRYGGPGGRGFKQSNVFVSLSAAGQEPVTKMMREDKNPLWYQQGRAVNDMLLPFYESPWWPFDANGYNQFKRR